MDEREVRERKAAIEREHGLWTAQDIPLGYGIGTNPQWPGCDLQFRRFNQAIADLCAKPWSELRILDLASLEGAYALEFASRGAQVLGIEGRESNAVKARFAAEALGLSNARFVTDDVRNLRKYGSFDVVFCSGILYHLPGLDACDFLESIAHVCVRLTIIDTHTALTDDQRITWRGHEYRGVLFGEHGPSDSAQTKANRKWASLDNDMSFWFTKPSLLNLLRDVGFTSAFELLNPHAPQDSCDRLALVALNGKRQTVTISPKVAQMPERDWPELPPPPRTSWWRKPRRIVRAVIRRLKVAT
jgi:hypothetical protein